MGTEAEWGRPLANKLLLREAKPPLLDDACTPCHCLAHRRLCHPQPSRYFRALHSQFPHRPITGQAPGFHDLSIPAPSFYFLRTHLQKLRHPLENLVQINGMSTDARQGVLVSTRREPRRSRKASRSRSFWKIRFRSIPPTIRC